MKLFAPKNNWDLLSSSSWWPMVGSIQTSSGVSITEDSALALTAFACGIRVISETIASLPCHFLQKKDDRTTEKATNETLYGIVHDEPNPEQDSMLFFDSQISLQVGWGNCYAEIERRGGQVVALWPIHPSRIPLSNITRNSTNPRDFDCIEVGDPGEIVYWVRNDDNTETPIAARDMLHVPGVLSRNGITGRSIVHLAKNALGIAQATEDHAGAFFRNGANPNIAIKFPTSVGPDTAKRLREQWQSVFGGVRNHYKTIILEDGAEPVPFTLSPQDSQLILSRKFSTEEIARALRIPPHMLMNLDRATFSNIEAQGLDLVIYSLMPWIVRWEKALQRQLLTPAQKSKYKFKFNVLGLLRGDQAARAAFYQAGFNMGVFSPNDIREYEDLNPVAGGDQRFVPANNLVPLELIGELAQANIDKIDAETDKLEAEMESASNSQPQPTQQPAQPPESDQMSQLSEDMASFRTEMAVRWEQMRNGFATSEDAEKFRDELRSLEQRITAAEQSTDREWIRDKFDALREQLAELKASDESIRDDIANIPKQIEPQVVTVPEPAPVDTSAIEAVAVREAEVERRAKELDDKLNATREASCGVLTGAIQVRLENLAEWESNALAKAIEKPTEFRAWREKFYLRFIKQFAVKLADLSAFAEQIGVDLDLEGSAEGYAATSVNDLKTLDGFAEDNWHDRLKDGSNALRKDLWANRPKELAAAMVEQGKQRFQERNHAG